MYRSFLLRMWYEEEGREGTGWQAEIQQIQSGESWTFSSREGLLAFLHKLMRLPEDSEVEPTPDNRNINFDA
jgi:hypothetical protein